jgi:hypothetical protein
MNLNYNPSFLRMKKDNVETPPPRTDPQIISIIVILTGQFASVARLVRS